MPIVTGATVITRDRSGRSYGGRPLRRRPP